MVKEIQYLYSNKNIPETQLQRQIRKVMAAKEKLYEQRESALEAQVMGAHKERLSNMNIGEMSFSDVSLLDEINKSDREPKHYYDINKTQNERDPAAHDPHGDIEKDKLERFNEAYTSVKGLMNQIQQIPGLDRYEGVSEKLGKCNEILQMLEKISEEGFDTGSINKIMKGYTRPKPCLLNKSINKSIRKGTNEYVVLEGSRYTRDELMEARNEINGILKKIDNY